MAKKSSKTEVVDIELDDVPMKEVVKETVKEEVQQPSKPQYSKHENRHNISCLRNEKVIVRHIPKETGMVTDPRHILYGGLAENAKRTFVVPLLRNGAFVNILTDSEKEFLEEVMGLEYNALSVYKTQNNYWDDSNMGCVNSVTLTKDDLRLDLSNPEDYIRYKILLANKDFIAPSMKELEDHPKATYQFVIIGQDTEINRAKVKMSTSMQAVKEFGKIEDNFDKLRYVLQVLEGRPVSPKTKIDFIQTKIYDFIQSRDSKRVLSILQDPLLDAKVLIGKAVEYGIISKRGDYYYLKADGSAICEPGQDPTLNVAAEYLNSPKHQDTLFAIQGKLNS